MGIWSAVAVQAMLQQSAGTHPRESFWESDQRADVHSIATMVQDPMTSSSRKPLSTSPKRAELLLCVDVQDLGSSEDRGRAADVCRSRQAKLWSEDGAM